MIAISHRSSQTYKLFKDLRIVDLSHIFSFSSPTWTGEVGFKPKVTKELIKEDNYHYRSYHVEMVQNIGTHIDSPAHFIENGINCSQLNLENLVNMPLCIIDIIEKGEKDHDYELSIDDITNFEKRHETLIPSNSIVVCKTGWDKYWGDPTKYRGIQEDKKMHYPGFSYDAVQFLNEKRDIAGIGSDTLSPETNIKFPIHLYLLGKNKFIVENLTNLERMPEYGGVISVFPLKIADITESPVRACGHYIA